MTITDTELSVGGHDVEAPESKPVTEVASDALAEYVQAEKRRAEEREAERARKRAEEDAAEQRKLDERIALIERYLGEPLALATQIRRARDEHLRWEAQQLAQLDEQIKAIPAKQRRSLDAELLAQTSIAPLVEKTRPSSSSARKRNRPRTARSAAPSTAQETQA